MFKGSTAIVTGGSKGIGFAIARELVHQGATVVICSRTKSELDKAVKKLSTSKNVFGVVADVSKFSDCKKLVGFAVAKTGRVDILINNAGIYGPIGLLENNDADGWKEVLGINVLGAVNCSKLVIPHMKKCGGGKIVNMAGAGVGGPKIMPRIIAYYTSKAAIASFTEALGAQLVEHNIQVNAIAPGGVASDLNLKLLKMDRKVLGEEMYKMVKDLKEQGGTPPELTAKLVAFLVSNKANHITGRLLSSKWDPVEGLEKIKKLSDNLFRLRRVDERTILEKND